MVRFIHNPFNEIEKMGRRLRGVAHRAEQVAKLRDYCDLSVGYEAWFENNLKIVNNNAELVPFRLNVQGKKILAEVERQRALGLPVRIIVLGPRRSHKSSTPAALGYTLSYTRNNIKCRIVAHRREAAKEIHGYTKRFFQETPKEFQRRLLKDSEGEIRFDNESSIMIISAKDAVSGHGLQTNYLHFAELAFVEDQDAALRALLPTVPDKPGTVIIIESTPNGEGNRFHQIWVAASEGRSRYAPIFTSWLEIPEWTEPVPQNQRDLFDSYLRAYKHFGVDPYALEESRSDAVMGDPALRTILARLGLSFRERELALRYGADIGRILWRRKILADPQFGGDEAKFESEYPTDAETCFLRSADTVFNIEKINARFKDVKKPEYGNLITLVVPDDECRMGVKFAADPYKASGDVAIWQRPNPNHEYIIGVDTASGQSGKHDYGVAVVIDRHTEDVVAELRVQQYPIAFAHNVDALRRYYSHDGELAPTIVENQGASAILIQLEMIDPAGLFYDVRLDMSGQPVTRKLGYTMTNPAKRALIDLAHEYINHGKGKIASEGLLRELSLFRRNAQGTGEVPAPNHDDRVIAFMLAYFYHLNYPMSKHWASEKPPYKEGVDAQSQQYWINRRDAMLRRRETEGIWTVDRLANLPPPQLPSVGF